MPQQGYLVNRFPANGPTLHPLKTLENLCLSGVFRGYKMGTLAGNGLTIQIVTRTQHDLRHFRILFRYLQLLFRHLNR